MLKDFTASIVLLVKRRFTGKSVKCASRGGPINRHIFDARRPQICNDYRGLLPPLRCLKLLLVEKEIIEKSRLFWCVFHGDLAVSHRNPQDDM